MWREERMNGLDLAWHACCWADKPWVSDRAVRVLAKLITYALDYEFRGNDGRMADLLEVDADALDELERLGALAKYWLTERNAVAVELRRSDITAAESRISAAIRR